MSDSPDNLQKSQEKQIPGLRPKSEPREANANPHQAEPEHQPTLKAAASQPNKYFNLDLQIQSLPELDPRMTLPALKTLAQDYVQGASYCTRDLGYDDYKHLSSLIDKLEAQNRLSVSEPNPENVKLEIVEYRVSPTPTSARFEQICRDFEEGEQIFVFAEGARGNQFLTKELNKDSPLGELKESELRSSDRYQGKSPLAALPEHKRNLLDNLIKQKQKQIDAEPVRNGPDHDEVYRLHCLFKETLDLEKFPDDDYCLARTKEARQAIRDSVKANPLNAEVVLEDFLRSRDLLHIEMSNVIYRIFDFKEIVRDWLPFETIRNLDSLEEPRRYRSVKENVLPLQRKEKIDKLSNEPVSNKDLPLDKPQQRKMTQTPATEHPADRKKAKEKQQKAEQISLLNADGKIEKFSPASRTEDLLNLSQKAKTAERKLTKEELATLNRWIQDKKTKSSAPKEKKTQQKDNKDAPKI